MRSLRSALVVGVALIALVAGHPARATAGEVQAAGDGRDAKAAVDVKRIWHTIDEQGVTFGVDTYAGFDNTRDFYLMEWSLDTNEDATPGDACIFLEQDGSGGLRATLFGECGAEAWSTADAKKSSASSLSFRFPMRDIRQGAGLEPGKELAYNVTARDMRGGSDAAPDGGLLTSHGVVPMKLNAFQQQESSSGGTLRPGEGEGPAPDRAGAAISADGSDQASTVSGAPGTTTRARTVLPWVIVSALLVAFCLLTFVALRRRRRVRDDAEWLAKGAALSPIHVPDTYRS